MPEYTGTFILATVGTSLLNHMKREFSTQDYPAKQAALSYLRSLEPIDPRTGAEINSIEHLLTGIKLSAGMIGPPFEFAFLVSETNDGRWVGEILESYYRSVRGHEHAGWYVVEGLSPTDPSRFARLGLRNLVRESCRLLRDAEKKGYLRVINATGGFKAQISFAGLIGQTLSVPVVYQFETFPMCVEMPPMPVNFDRQTWLMHYDLFVKLSEAGSLEQHEFPFNEVDPVIRDLLDFLPDNQGGLYSLSPILELMHQGFLLRRPAKEGKPPRSERPVEDRLALSKSELPHDPNGTEKIARAIARKFDWVVEIKNHTPRMNSARSHVLERGDDRTVQWICYSDGTLGVRLSIRTTCEHEGHVEYVGKELADFLLKG